jgi:hypothetical protein
VSVRGVRADRGGSGVSLVGPTDGGTFQDLMLVGGSSGLAFAGDGANLTHAKISDVTSVDNGIGAFVIGGSNKLKNVHAAANDATGIRVVGSGGDVVEKSRAMANGGAGILLATTDGSAVRKSVALGNFVDLADDDSTCGDNVWEKNVFLFGSVPCIR